MLPVCTAFVSQEASEAMLPPLLSWQTFNNTIQVVLTEHHAVWGHSSGSSLIFSDYQHLLLKTLSLLESQKSFPASLEGYFGDMQGLLASCYKTIWTNPQTVSAEVGCLPAYTDMAPTFSLPSVQETRLIHGGSCLRVSQGTSGQSQRPSPELSQREG